MWGSQVILEHVKMSRILAWWEVGPLLINGVTHPILEEDSRTVVFLKDLLSGVAALEKDAQLAYYHLISTVFNKNLLLFVNLQYWPSHHALLENCMGFL